MLKTITRKTLSGLLAAALILCQLLPAAAAPAQTDGEKGWLSLTSESTTQIHDQLELHRNSGNNTSAGTKLAENYFVYTPGWDLTPYISYGNDIAGAASMSRAAMLEENNGNHIMAAVNGDMFIMSSGVPLGLCIKNGVILTSEHSSNASIGFTADGKLRMGRADLKISLKDSDADVSWEDLPYNKTMSRDVGAILYSSAYGDSNIALEPTLNVVMEITSGEAKAGKTIKAVVKEIREDEGRLTLREDQLVLSIYKSSYISTQELMREMSVGDEIRVSFSTSDAWEDVVQSIGCEKRLLTDGEAENFSDNTRAPRTAVGLTREGKIVIYTADGRQSGYSSGLSYAELAQRMLELGCTDAVNLDGGDSTQCFAALPGCGELSQINRNSGASLRSAANYLCFKNNAKPTGKPVEIYAYPSEISVYSGCSTKLTVKARDANYYPVEGLEYEYSFSSEDLGSVEDDIFTAARQRTEGYIMVSRYTLSTSIKVNVLTEGELIENFENVAAEEAPINEDLNYVHNGSRSLLLSADAYYPIEKSFKDKQPTMISMWVCPESEDVVISVHGEGRKSDPEIKYKEELIAGEWQRILIRLPEGFTASKGISCAGGSVYIDQVVAGYGHYIDDTAPELSAQVSEQMLIGQITDDLDAEISDSLISVSYDGEPVDFSYNPSTGTITSLLPEADGRLHHVIVKASDLSGNLARISIADDTASDNTTKAAVVFSDMSSKNWSLPYVQYMYDHGIISGKLDTQTSKLSFDPASGMTRQEFAKVMVVYLGADTADYEETELIFEDSDKIASWAQPYVKAALGLGIMNGKSSSGAKLKFDPNGSITRQEVMTVIGRLLEKGYTASDLSEFSDSDRVASWARPYVETLVAIKVIGGSEGRLSPEAVITREQVAKIIFELK